MPTFENPAADADEVQTALRALAHATRSIDDPRQIYSVLGSLTSAVVGAPPGRRNPPPGIGLDRQRPQRGVANHLHTPRLSGVR
jgi:hypothetical protein